MFKHMTKNNRFTVIQIFSKRVIFNNVFIIKNERGSNHQNRSSNQQESIENSVQSEKSNIWIFENEKRAYFVTSGIA